MSPPTLQIAINFPPSAARLPVDQLKCWEQAGTLVIHVPARPGKLLLRFGGFAFSVIAFLLLVVYVTEGWLPPILMFAAIGTLFLSVAWASWAEEYLTDTHVQITTQSAVVKTVLYGRQTSREYVLDPKSHARQWYLRRGPASDVVPRPQGIEIGSVPYDAEAGSDPNDSSLPRFGAGLSPGELDWLEWRINRFLLENQGIEESSTSISK